MGWGIGAVVLALVAVLFGVDPGVVLQGAPDAAPEGKAGGARPDGERAVFTEAVLTCAEDTWNQLFQQYGLGDHPEPTLVVFEGATQSGCGFARAAVGPFYCPADRQVYTDPGFYDRLRREIGAGGDFAQAYVVAHEVGHQVRTVLGISQQVDAARRGLSEGEANALSLRQELQADCYAGLWAHHTRQRFDILEAGDVDEALNAASASGDDALLRQSQGYVVPESFTHGTSEQRVRWYRRGLEIGDLRACDTFAAAVWGNGPCVYRNAACHNGL